MMKITKTKKYKTTTFEIKSNIYKGFYVDITDNGEEFEAWLYHEDIAIKSGMFGCLKKQSVIDDITFDGFVEMVVNNLVAYPYIDDYIDEFMND